MSVNQKILDAIELLTNHSIEKAGYDKTIQAQIISCEDATIGKYKCSYQGTTFIAYSGSADVSYSKGAFVYILIPGNDMSKDKTILGTTQKLGINYISEAEGEQAYDILGKNCVTTSGLYYFATKYKKYSYTIYKYGVTSPLKIDTDSLNQYIKKSSSLIVGMTIRNSIPLEKQYQGHYGITFNLVFYDNSNLETNGKSKEIIRSYTLDEDNMTGNPYRFQHDTRQYEIFNIDGENFVKIDSVELFCQNFPNSLQQELQHNPLRATDKDIDIFISSIEILGAIRKTDEQNNGISISFYTPEGTFFKQSQYLAPFKLPITAQVKIKGKIVSDSQDLKFYWGKEDSGIFVNSQYYNKYLGRGWRCMNEKNIISPATATQNPQIEWIPGTDTYIYNKEDATSKKNKIKVAVLYDGTVISKEITIQSLQTNIPNITIESNSGTQFYYDIGHPTLTCKINNAEDIENYIYRWAWQNNNAGLQSLLSTDENNEIYNNAYDALQELNNAINNGQRFKNEAQQELNEYETIISNFKYTQRVQKNKIYDLQINKINEFAIFKCTVYDLNDNYIGTASITLNNSLQAQDKYSLIIENGSVTYKYNQDGIAPNSKSLDDPQEILVLTFKVYDNLGNDITEDIKKKQVIWKIPIENTLLIDQDKDKNTRAIIKEEDGYRYYSNMDAFLYNIAQKYDVKKQNNQIELFITYKEINLIAKTNFTFVKQGQPGTNGTQYMVKIVPYCASESAPRYPLFTMIGDNPQSFLVNYSLYTPIERTLSFNNGTSLFKVQLWESGNLVWQSYYSGASAKDGVTKPSSLIWSILKNLYKNNESDKSSFNVSYNNYGYIQYVNTNANPVDITFSESLANIVKCEVVYKQHSYYGTIPITTAWIINDSYRIQLKDYTGFRYVTYTSDGVSPQYDNSKPFQFIAKQKINEKWEDISLVQGEHAVDFSFSISGDTKNLSTLEKINSNNLELLTQTYYTKDLQKNQCICRPSSRYDGECVNNALICTVTRDGQVLARIHVPIHFLLNKYGLAHINAWDGNSVQVDNEGGYILAPQMGAGKKNNQNQFTGVLMGEVKNPNKTKSENGLLGYYNGDRTFFLNSENGSAIFGKSNNGQIIIDPTKSQALLYSAGFWKDYDPNTGLPINYNSNNEYKDTDNIGRGLLINLTKPQIRYGNGKFKVDKNGNLTATNANISGAINSGSGQIGGWIISGGSISSRGVGSGTTGIKIVSDKTTENDNEGRIYSGAHSSFESTADGFFISKKGLSIGAKFRVDKNGYLNATNVDLTGKITASSGKIGEWQILGRELKAEDGKGGYISLDYEGSISGPNWSISNTGDAYFGKIYGTVMSGQSLSGYGFTIGGSSGSYFAPGSVLMDGNAFGGAGSLGNGLYSAYKAKFDKIYATEAEFGSLSASVGSITNAYLTNANITERLYVDGVQAKWIEVVTDVWIEENGEERSLYIGTGRALGRDYVHSYGSPYRYYVGWL